MKGQYDIMEQEKQVEEKKDINISPKIFIGTMIVMVLAIVVLGIRLGVLEDKLKEYHGQTEESELTLESEQNGNETETESKSDVSDLMTEQEDFDSVDVKDITVYQEDETTEIKHKVYLTFDDGPSSNTEAILDILDQYGVKATFFVLGKEDATSVERLQMIYERGHTIGMHSYSHVYSDIYYSLDNFKADFWKSKQYLMDTIGADCMFYRFPGGSSNTATNMNMQECVDFLKEQGVEYYDWNIVSGDGSSRKLSKEVIIRNCTESIVNYGTSIILLHDASSKTETVEALPEIIEAILAIEGAAILPITENTKAVHHVISSTQTEQPIPDLPDDSEPESQDESQGGTAEEKSAEETEPEQNDSLEEQTEGVPEETADSQTGE